MARGHATCHVRRPGLEELRGALLLGLELLQPLLPNLICVAGQDIVESLVVALNCCDALRRRCL